MITTFQNDADCNNPPTTVDGGLLTFREADIPRRRSKAGVGRNDKAAAKGRAQELIRNHGTVSGKGTERNERGGKRAEAAQQKKVRKAKKMKPE